MFDPVLPTTARVPSTPTPDSGLCIFGPLRQVIFGLVSPPLELVEQSVEVGARPAPSDAAIPDGIQLVDASRLLHDGELPVWQDVVLEAHGSQTRARAQSRRSDGSRTRAVVVSGTTDSAWVRQTDVVGGIEPTWWDAVLNLRDRDAVPAAQANADLLVSMEADWDGKVVSRTSMHDLLFTLPGDPYPFRADVRVHWIDDVFEITLARQGLVVAADRCRAGKAVLVVNAFLLQLLSEGPEPVL